MQHELPFVFVYTSLQCCEIKPALTEAAFIPIAVLQMLNELCVFAVAQIKNDTNWMESSKWKPG